MTKFVRKFDIPIGETFVAPDGQTYKVVRSDAASTCRGCAFDTDTTVEFCRLYSCMSDYRKDHKDVHFVRCEEEQGKENK